MGPKKSFQILKKAYVPFWNLWKKMIYKLANISVKTEYITKPQIFTCFKTILPANSQCKTLIYNNIQELKKI